MREAKEQDRLMKKEIHRDHLAEMFTGDQFSKKPIVSEFKDEFSNFYT